MAQSRSKKGLKKLLKKAKKSRKKDKNKDKPPVKDPFAPGTPFEVPPLHLTEAEKRKREAAKRNFSF